jgi:WD40 repeat protein/tetratricopeptide (TPR) repeat protein
VVTASADQTARVWDARTGQPLTEPLRHNGVVTSAQFSPDGQRLVTASWDKTARIWDARTGQPLSQPLQHNGLVNSAQFSPDGLRLVTVSSDKTARVWDAWWELALAEPLKHREEVLCAQFSSDGQRVVTGSLDRTARVWEVQPRQPLTVPLKHKKTVQSAQFSPDGQRLVTASWDKTARVWDARTGQPLTAPLRHEDRVWSAQFSPDGQRVVTASMDKTARVWDAQTGQPLAEPLRHNGVVVSAQFSPDGHWVVTASVDQTARVWDARTGQPLTEPLRHNGMVVYAQFSPDGQRVVTASWDQTARVWDAHTGQPLTEPLRHNIMVGHAQFSPDGQRVVTASADQFARVWEVPSVPLPTPSWILELAEAAAGERINDRGVTEFLPSGDPVNLQEHMARDHTTNAYTRWAQWFFADRTTRTISPASSVTVSQYILQRIRENTPASLIEALQMSPTNGLAFARLARIRLREDLAQNSRASAEADFFMRRALQLSPDEPEAWLAQAEVLRHSGKRPEALAAIISALGRLPQATPLWLAKGRFLEEANRLGEAVAAFSRTIELAGPDSALANLHNEALSHRASLLRRLKRVAESNADYERLLGTGYLSAPECNDRAWGLVVGPVASRDPELGVILAQRAVQVEPENWMYRNTLGVAQYQAGEHRKAVETLLQAGKLSRDGLSAYDLFFLAMAQEKLGDPQMAKDYYDQALRWQKKPPTGTPVNWRELQSFQAETEKVLGIRQPTPPRNPAAGGDLLDLTAFYNASLKRNWHGDEPGNNLASLGTGVQTLAGTDFDVRALIQVQLDSEIYPAQITNMQVARGCRSLYFLHGASNAAKLTNGTPAGRYVIHLNDGTRFVMPLLMGRDLGDWWEQRGETNTMFSVAWTGTNDKSRRTGGKIRLFKSTWQNPRPDVAVRSIDFQATHDQAGPFLIALTVEP